MTTKRKTKKVARERILEVAFKLFSEKGFQGATTQQIAKEAEVNEVTIFRLFGSKQNLLSDILQEFIISKHILAVDEDKMLLKHPNDPEGFFVELASEICSHLRQTIPFVKMQMLEGSCENLNKDTIDCICEIPQTARKKLESVFEKCAELGWLRKKASYASLCASFYGPYFGYFMNRANFGERVYPEPPKDMIQEITENFLYGALKK
jgi:AcrR family transcriptional regulator